MKPFKSFAFAALFATCFASAARAQYSTRGVLTYISNVRTLYVIDAYGAQWCDGLGQMRIYQSSAADGVSFGLTQNDGVLFQSHLISYGPSMSRTPENYNGFYLAQSYWSECKNAEYAAEWIQSHYCSYTTPNPWNAMSNVFPGYPINWDAISFRESASFDESFHF